MEPRFIQLIFEHLLSPGTFKIKYKSISVCVFHVFNPGITQDLEEINKNAFLRFSHFLLLRDKEKFATGREGLRNTFLI